MDTLRYFPPTIVTSAIHTDMPKHDTDKYWIRVTASNDKPDLHHSPMDPKTTLRNFENEAKTAPGVALKDHHAYRSFRYGRSNDAVLIDKNELMIDFYILKNMEYEGQGREFRTSEKLIRAIEHGLINQVSLVEFGSNRDTAIQKKHEMRSVIQEILMTDQQWIDKIRTALDMPLTGDPETVVHTPYKQKLPACVNSWTYSQAMQKQAKPSDRQNHYRYPRTARGPESTSQTPRRP